jgi:flagellar P-ring protein precursor FlgI
MMLRILFLALFLSALAWDASAMVRIKDITMLRNGRDLQLIGYGLVVGLQGSGDTLRNSPFTEQAIQSMLNRMGPNVLGSTLGNRNVAAVIVTADMSVGTRVGSRLDVTVSALGDAPSLMGGTLVLTQLSAPDGQVYASAQGALAVTGFEAQGQAETLTQGVPTTGRIANGAIVESPTPIVFDDAHLSLELKNPDFTTAIRITDAINAFSRQRYHQPVARETDARTVEIQRPYQVSSTRFIAEIGALAVEPDSVARVVLDARTGTVVIGQDVHISTVAVTHGTLTVRVNETPQVSQPAPFSQGRTTVTPNTRINAFQEGGQVQIIGGSSLRSLVNGLNRIGVKPSGIIAILQAIKSAGALQADLVVQ